MGWIAVNILAPLLLPVIGVLLIQMATPKRVKISSAGNYKLMMLVKDGQLGWAAAALCTSSYYEFTENQRLLGENFMTMPSQWQAIIFPLFLSTLGAMFVAASGAVYGTELLEGKIVSLKSWIEHYSLFVVSIFVTISSALMFIIIHFEMIPHVVIHIIGGK
ncbi:hypothetical protein [Methylobacterium sp. XJLW]|uniref:hypothetical protein n=1 Tax=Methylobacterium sp. XJLW TaxID=739141 RepID=UPI000F55822C|nr:hypothetical protein [Methylobacterium sp. XJLW]